MNIDLHLNSEDAPRVRPAHESSYGGHRLASVAIGDLTIHMRNEDGAHKAIALADALNEAAGSLLDAMEDDQ